MSPVIYTTTTNYGEMAAKNYHYSQAVRIGDFIEIAGQGGWNPDTATIPDANDEAAQIAQTFENVALVLKGAGAERGWDQVYKIRSYHAKHTDKTNDLMIAAIAKHCPNHNPAWTEIGVDKLGLDDMRVEVEVMAYVGDESKKY